VRDSLRLHARGDGQYVHRLPGRDAVQEGLGTQDREGGAERGREEGRGEEEERPRG
jgi:hypothetical protein